jgi:hypothetical protein
MLDNTPDGTYFSPDEKRVKLHETLKDAAISDLRFAVKVYSEWLENGRIDSFKLTVCREVFYKMGYTAEGNVAEFSGLLEIYDAVCREIARRHVFKKEDDPA